MKNYTTKEQEKDKSSGFRGFSPVGRLSGTPHCEQIITDGPGVGRFYTLHKVNSKPCLPFGSSLDAATHLRNSGAGSHDKKLNLE